MAKSPQIQIFGLIAALFCGCATSGDGGPRGAAMPTLNQAALSICKPLTTWDFAFTSTAGGDSDIYLYRAASGSIEKITDSGYPDHWATWSQDGRMLAFQSLRDGNREVYIKVLGSDAAVNASQNDEQDLLPAWSPNDQYIVYFSSRDTPWSGTGLIGGHLYVMRVQGAFVGRIQTEPFFSTTAIAWSPDSRTLFYARYAQGKQGIYALDIQTGVETAMLALENRSPGIASANPASGTVDYFVEQDDGVAIYQLSLDDGISRRLTPGHGKHYYAAWSPDRTALLVTSAQDEAESNFDIRCVAADGSYDVAVIDDTSDARSAAWRPGSH